jgi:methionine-rich copper-binding protein CopC
MLSIAGLSPSEGEKNVSLDSVIEFTIIDDGNGIDISTLHVEVSGFIAITAATFTTEYDGILSEITPVGNDFSIVVNPISNFGLSEVLLVKIQVKDLNGKYFNYSYNFKTIPNEPILINSSPKNNAKLIGPQLLSLDFQDQIDGINLSSINIWINKLAYFTNSVPDSNYNGVISDVTATSSTTARVRVDPIEPLRDGNYKLTYSVSDTVGNIATGEISFSVTNPQPNLPSNFPQTGFLGWFQGIKRVTDLGAGDSLKVEWNTPIKKNYKNDVYLLIYQQEKRLEVFDHDPLYFGLSSAIDMTINGLIAGNVLSFGVRALELPNSIIDSNGMNLITSGVFSFPSRINITQQVSDIDLLIHVDSTIGYPDSGLLLIGLEAIRYTSIDRNNNVFIIPSNGRGALDTIAAVYLVGDEVKMFSEYSDSNTVIIMGTPTYHDGYEYDRQIGLDGVVTTDLTDNDRMFFQGYDFCGYHDPLPQNTLQGKNGADCGSYLGGEFNGMRGFDIYDRMLNREEVLLDQTGEPAILLKRIWTGQTCTCLNSRKVSPKIRSCGTCMGTGFVGGYTQFNYLRRNDYRVMLKFDEAPEDLFHGDHENLQQDYEPGAWTLPMPGIKDRDVVVRFDFTNDIEFIYEVLNVSREKVLYGKYGRQKLSLKRMDKSDILYTFPFDLSRIS